MYSLFRQISSSGDTYAQHRGNLQYRSFLDIQLDLLNHIVAAEKRITRLRKAATNDSDKISESQHRRRLLRLLGTTVAWILLEFDRPYIRAFSRGHDPGFIYGKAGYKAEVIGLAAAFESPGCAGVLHDITNCLRIGDLTIISPSSTVTLELKLRKNKRRMDRRERRQNRRGRITREWYEKGTSTELIPGHVARRHVAAEPDEHNWRAMSLVLEEAINRGFAVQCLENCMLYCSFRVQPPVRAVGAMPDIFDCLLPDALREELATQLRAFKDPYITFGCNDRHIEGLPGLLPFTCFDIADRYKEKLLLEELYFCVLLDMNSLREIIEQNGYFCKILQDGRLEVIDTSRKEDGPMVVGGNLMARVLYECMSVKTFLRYLREMREMSDLAHESGEISHNEDQAPSKVRQSPGDTTKNREP
jgi:hypothetical protein